jgi:cyclophilin family peptidyl-prolyl cis-trans isomerase
MIAFVSNEDMPESVRFIAANYLFRAKDVDVSEQKFQLSRVFSQHKDPRIRMALARPLAKTADREILNILLGQLSADDDYRVKCNIIRELGEFEYIDVVERILRLVKHDNEHIANSAASYLVNNGNPKDALIYLDFAKESSSWQAKAKIYQAVLKHLPAYYTNSRARVRNEIIQQYNKSENEYEKAALLEAVAEDFKSYTWIRDNAMQDSSMVVKMRALSQLGGILSHEQFDQVFTGRRRYTRTVFLNIFKDAIETGDAGLIALASEFIQDEKSRLKELIDDASFLEDAKQKLSLPKDLESYQSLQSAINYLNDSEPPKALPVYTANRIDWRLINELSDSSRAFIFTSKGKIGLKFNYKQTPGSVANFIKLAEDDFFDGKVFHRVVPNFVIQGGCPRGDGFGSLDYTIRSELSSGSYSHEGKVGMASAGNHTECTQWFITHSPTPHLDGNYSLFGEVVSGMDVVHKIQVGDIIEDVRILKL